MNHEEQKLIENRYLNTKILNKIYVYTQMWQNWHEHRKSRQKENVKEKDILVTDW